MPQYKHRIDLGMGHYVVRSFNVFNSHSHLFIYFGPFYAFMTVSGSYQLIWTYLFVGSFVHINYAFSR